MLLAYASANVTLRASTASITTRCLPGIAAIHASCSWRAGVKAERRAGARAALAADDASCAAGLQIGGCYEAGKI